MPLTLITGPANSGKARAVLDRVRAEAQRGREPLLVVPTRADAGAYRRELAEAGLVFGARVERFDGLVAEIARRAGVSATPLGAFARERLIAHIATTTPLRALAAAARTPGFVRVLAHDFAELRSCRVEPDALRAALRRGTAATGAEPSVVGQDVATLYGRYRGALDDLGRCDREGLAVEALDALRSAPARWGGTPVCFYGFDDLTPIELDAIETLVRIVDAPVTVALAYEAGRLAFAGRATLFETLRPLAAEHLQLAPRADHYAAGAEDALHHLERELFEEASPRRGPGGAVRLLEGGGERAELELVAGEIRALLDRGVPAEEIALVTRAAGRQAALIADVLGTAGIPFSLRRRVAFGRTGIGRGLIALLRCAVGEGDGEDLLRWLRAPGVVREQRLVDRLEARARADGASSADDLRELWETGQFALDALDRVAAAAHRGGRALVGQMLAELERLLAAPWRRTAPLLAGDELDEASAAGGARRALGELADDRALMRLLEGGREGVASELIDALEALEVVVGPNSGPGVVSVVDPLALRARRVRALLLCGLQEGVFPAAPASEPLLGPEERRALAVAGVRLPRRADEAGSERYLLYATVSRPEELLCLSWHVADDAGTPIAPSLFVDDVRDLFDETLTLTRRRRSLGAVGWPGPGAAPPGVLSAAPPPQEREAPPVIAPLHDERLLAALREAPWSASGLETWIGCPVRWFVERRLRADELEPEPDVLAQGGVAHAALEATYRGLRERTGSARITPDRLGLAQRLVVEALAELIAERPLSWRPERRAGALRRLEADLQRYLAHCASIFEAWEPAYLELAFGMSGEEESWPAFAFDEGVRLRGRIDRIDVSPAGDAVVYDYKARTVPEPARWVSDGRVQMALYMRAAQQLLGVRVVGGFYQPLGGRDLRARGVLATDAPLAQPCVNGDRRDQADIDALLDETVAVARAAAAEARAGRLEPRPRTCAFGGGCLYPSICRCAG